MSYDIVKEIAESRGGLALVTVIDTQGSVPRHAGSRMLVRDGAVSAGTVGGGKGEARAILLAKECVENKKPALLTLEFHGTEVEGQDMICGGTARILIECIDDPEPYRAAFERLKKGERTLFVKRLRFPAGGAAGTVELSVFDEKGRAIHGSVPSPSGSAAGRALDSGKPAYAEEDGVFVDPVFPEEKLLILGGGYVGQAVAALAARLDFTITVGDDRKEFSAAGRFPPGVATLCGTYSEIVEKFPFDSATYVVMVTRGHLTDLECARAVLKKKYRYAGFIGSSRKAVLLREQLRNDGYDARAVDALHAPIGLDINAETPAELAVAILAQIVSVRRNAEAQK